MNDIKLIDGKFVAIPTQRVIKKVCSKCGKEYKLEEFTKNNHCKDGFTGTCRKCSNKYSHEWKYENRERLNIERRERYASIYGEIRKEKERIRRKQNPFRMACRHLRAGMSRRARNQGLQFDDTFFTIKYLIGLLSEKPYCECCGRKLDIGPKFDKKPHASSPSMDRFNPGKGYIKGNVALLCFRCNSLKRDATSNELRVIADWMDAWGEEVKNDIDLLGIQEMV